MKNPHIIVGEPRHCLCGTYNNNATPTSCADILAAVERQVQAGSPDARLIAAVIQPLVQDCN